MSIDKDRLFLVGTALGLLFTALQAASSNTLRDAQKRGVKEKAAVQICTPVFFRHASSILYLSALLQALLVSSSALGLFGLKDNSK